MKATKFIAVIFATALFGCGGGGGSGDGDGGGGVSNGASNGICRAIGGGASTVSTSPAATASFSDATKIFDGDLNSFGVLNTIGGTGTSSVKGTLQAGLVEPAGVVAGVLFGGGVNSNLQVTITTFLSGTQQDTGVPLTTSSRDSQNFYGLRTTKSFDSIQATFALSGDSASININELCVAN